MVQSSDQHGQDVKSGQRRHRRHHLNDQKENEALFSARKPVDIFLAFLSIVIIYPLLITASSAFRVGNVAAFTLDFSGAWTLDHFKRLFEETLYLNWYGATFPTRNADDAVIKSG